MNRPMIRYVLGSIKREIAVGILIVVLITILQRSPMRPTIWEQTSLDSTTQWLPLCMMLLAALLPIRILHEPSGVAAWLNSRGVQRGTRCLSQLISGGLILAAIALTAAVVQAFGIRQAVQLALGSPWFPMVRWYELTSIPFALALGWGVYGFSFLLVTAAKSSGSLFPNMRVAMAALATLPLIAVTSTLVSMGAESEFQTSILGGVVVVGFLCLFIAVGIRRQQEANCV